MVEDEEQAPSREVLLRLLIEAAPIGFLVVRSDGEIRRVNEQVESMFGYSRDELLEQPVEMLLPEYLRDVHREHRGEYGAHPSTRRMGAGLHLLGRRKDGSEFQVDISLSPVETPRGVWTIALVQDVTERNNLEQERANLLLALEMEQERQRIGMDLHDGVMQEIYATSLTLELALEDIPASNAEGRAGVERAIEQLHNVTRSIRSYIFDLRPRHFTGNLVTAIEDLAREFQQNSQIRTFTDVAEPPAEIPTDKAVALYQIVHESLTNIQKHAQAHTVRISMVHSGRSLRLEIADDGVGFNPQARRTQEHRGLRNMRARAIAIGGALTLSSAPGKGAAVTVDLPLAV
jgi:PAS domain S-box-containing protein